MTSRALTPEEAKDPLAFVGGGQDRVAFPEFYAEYDRRVGPEQTARLALRGQWRADVFGRTQVKRDIANLKAAAAKARVKDAFLPVVAPASALPNAKDEYYPGRAEPAVALADCLHQEYKAIVDAGLYVQIDDAFLPYMHEKMVPPMTHAQYRAMGADCASTRSITRSRASRRSARAITSAGEAGTDRMPSTCR